MYTEHKITKVISIITLVTFLFTNSLQASLPDLQMNDKIATDSRHEVTGTVANEEAAAREEVAAFLRILVNRIREEHEGEVTAEQLVVALRSACQTWSEDYAERNPALQLDLSALIAAEILNIVPQAQAAEFEVGAVTADATRVAQIVNIMQLLPGQTGQDEVGDCAVFCHVGPSIAEGGDLDPVVTSYQGAEQLEHRGYQSSGGLFIGTKPDGTPVAPARATVLAGADGLRDAMAAIPQEALDNAKVTMVHLRWPTTSPATHPNQHPITVGSISVMFNGDITNYDIIDARLANLADEKNDNNLRRPGNVETDAWTISALVYYHYRYNTPHRAGEREDLLRAMRMAYNEMDGYFAAVVGTTDFPDSAFGFVKSAMPLYIGLGENRPGAKIGNFLSSEPGALVRWSRYSQKVQDGDIAVITADSASVYRPEDDSIPCVSRVIPEDITHAIQTNSLPTQGIAKEYTVKELNPEEYTYVREPGNKYYCGQEIYYQDKAISAAIWGFVPPALYPDKMLYQMTDEDLIASARYRDRLYQIVIDEQRLPTAEEMDGKAPATNENRVGVLRQWIDDPQAAAAADLRLTGVNISVAEIGKKNKLLFACSGTAGYAAKAQKGMIEDITGMDVEVKSGTEYVDKIDSKLRRVFRNLKRSLEKKDTTMLEFLSKFMTPEQINKHFPGGEFKAKSDPEDLVAFIEILIRLEQDKYKEYAQFPEYSSFRKLRSDAQETLGVAVSQSGTTKDTLNIILIAQALGMRFMSIINKPGVTDIGAKTEDDAGLMLTYAGNEKGVASTKAHTCQQAVISELGIWLGMARGTLSPEYAKEKLDNLLALPKQVQQVLQTLPPDGDGKNNWAKAVAGKLAGLRCLMYLGRGGDDRLFTTAREGGLKMKELTYILVFEDNTGEMKHGPISYFKGTKDPNIRTYCVVLLTDAEVIDKALLNLSEITARFGSPICIVYGKHEKRVRERLMSKAREEIQRNEREVEDLKAHIEFMGRQNLTTKTFLGAIRSGTFDAEIPEEQRNKLLDLLTKLVSTGGDLNRHIQQLQMTNAMLQEMQDNIYVVPVEVEDDLSPIATVLPLQVLAYETTIEINERSKAIGSLSSRLYWFLTRYRRYYDVGQEQQALLDAEYSKLLSEIEHTWNMLLYPGKLGGLDEMKLSQTRQALTDAVNAANVGDRITRAGRLMLVLSSEDINKVALFENAIQEYLPDPSFPAWDKAQLETARGLIEAARQESEQVEGTEAEKQEAFFKIATAKLAPIESIIANRQGFIAKLRAAGTTVENTRLAEIYAGWFTEAGVSECLRRDPDKPRNLAKSVTVEDRIPRDMVNELRALGLSQQTIDSMGRAFMRLEGVGTGARIKANRSFLRLYSEAAKKTMGEVTREVLFHEKMHNMLSLLSGLDRSALSNSVVQALDKVEAAQRQAGKPVFTQRFRQKFGTFDDATQFVEEVIIKYYSAKFEGRGVELFEGIGEEIDRLLGNTTITFADEHLESLAGVLRIQIPSEAAEKEALFAQLRERLPENLFQAFDISSLSQFDIGNRRRAEGVSPQVMKFRQIFAIATALGATPRIDFEEEPPEEVEAQVAQARHELLKRRVPQADMWTQEEVERMQGVRQQLMAQGVTFPSVHEEFSIGPEVDVRRIKKGTYIHSGTVILGKDTFFGEACQISGTVVNVRARNGVDIINPKGMVISDTSIGSFSKIQNSPLSNMDIEANVTVVDSKLSATSDGSFGDGISIAVGSETGGREITVYATMTYDEAAQAAMDRENAAAQTAHAKKVKESVAGRTEKRKGRGRVGMHSLIIGARNVVNADIGEHAVLNNPISVTDCTVLSSKEEPVEISDGAIVGNSIVQWGCKVKTGAIVSDSIMFEHSEAERGAKITSSVLGPCDAIGQGEVTSCLLGPLVVSHHPSVLIGMLAPKGKINIGAQSIIAANHGGMQPWGEVVMPEGLFAGVKTSMGATADFGGSPYLYTGRNSNVISFQVVDLPFSLISRKQPTRGLPETDLETIAHLAPDVLFAEPGLTNEYMLARNEDKWKTRYMAQERNPIDLEIHRPDMMDVVIQARDRIQAALQANPDTELFVGSEDKPEEGTKGMPGLGKNFTTRQAAERGIRLYNARLRYYAFRGLRNKLKEIADSGVTSWNQVQHRLVTDAGERWQHERRVLREQFGIDVATLSPVTASVCLRESIKSTEQRLAAVRQMLDAEYRKGMAVLESYEATHPSVDEEEFINGTFAVETEKFVGETEIGIESTRETFAPQMAIPAILQHTHIPDLLLSNDDSRNAPTLRALVSANGLVDKKVEDRIGTICTAQFILQNAGAREALEKLEASQNAKAGEYVTVVEAQNEEEKLLVEALDLPLVHVVLAKGADMKARIGNLVAELDNLGVKDRKNIGCIADPSLNQTPQQLEEATEDVGIYVGVVNRPEPGQLLSVHAAFHGVIDAVASKKPASQRVFAIKLPAIEQPSAELQQRLEEYLEAIEFLKNA